MASKQEPAQIVYSYSTSPAIDSFTFLSGAVFSVVDILNYTRSNELVIIITLFSFSYINRDLMLPPTLQTSLQCLESSARQTTPYLPPKKKRLLVLMRLLRSAKTQCVMMPSFWYWHIGVIPRHTTTKPFLSAVTILDPEGLNAKRLTASLWMEVSSFACFYSSFQRVTVPNYIIISYNTILPPDTKQRLRGMPIYSGRLQISCKLIVVFITVFTVKQDFILCAYSYRWVDHIVWYA